MSPRYADLMEEIEGLMEDDALPDDETPIPEGAADSEESEEEGDD